MHARFTPAFSSMTIKSRATEALFFYFSSRFLSVLTFSFNIHTFFTPLPIMPADKDIKDIVAYVPRSLTNTSIHLA
jgi:hypothetical protein